ncbi:MAG: MBL fold metallo-hydrolase [bacterium]|nr:MBL fold metallo-hydrolase [bacterium]
MARLTCHGGAGTVTGANFLLDFGDSPAGKKILVDCGIHERDEACDPRNYGAFPYDPKTIDALFITHAHADHIGRVPKLVRDGFKGVIYSTPATKELSGLMFDDALNVMRQDLSMESCGMLYEEADVEQALSLWQTHEYHEPFKIGDTQAEFLDAGHILGSAMVKFSRNKRTIIFSGDLGNSPEPLLNDTESPEGANYLLMESVYGDRVHEAREQRLLQLRQAIDETRAKKGVLLIPSFSLERTQVLLFEIFKMAETGPVRGLASNGAGALPPIPVYLDSPLAIRITEVFRRYKKLMNPRALARFSEGNDPFAFPGLTLTAEMDESKRIHKSPNPKIIIAGAGMSHGGRIRSHEKTYLGDNHTTILFVGYQAPGSLGRRIQEGQKRVEIDGEHITVRARIETVTGYSGHKDRDGLLEFASQAEGTLEKVLVTMGEPKASLFLAQRIKDFLGVESIVPEEGQSFILDW